MRFIRMDSIFNQKDVSWLLPPAVMPELPPADRQQTIALTLHLMYCESDQHTQALKDQTLALLVGVLFMRLRFVCVSYFLLFFIIF